MPFAALPSSPGFIQPQAPDWGRFALQANELIQRGGEMRAQAGKDLINQMDKSFMQVSKIMEYNSPEARLKRKMEMIKNQALTELYEDFRLHKDKYTMTAHGPMLTDPYQQQLRAARLREATSAATLNETRAGKEAKKTAYGNQIDQLRDSVPKDLSGLPPTANQAQVPGSSQSQAPELIARPAEEVLPPVVHSGSSAADDDTVVPEPPDTETEGEDSVH